MRKLIKFFFKSKFNIKFPARNDILVLDPITSHYLIKIIKKFDYIFLPTRHEEINLKILFYSLLNYNKFSNLTIYQKYLINYISIVNPKVIITCTSHNIFFLSLKKYFPNSKIVVIQHAFLSAYTLSDILKKKLLNKIQKKFSVDYMCVWGKNSKNFYSNFIDCKNYLITGSILNNYFKRKKQKNNLIFLISQVKFIKSQHIKFTTERFEQSFYRNLNLYCKKNKKKICVLSVSRYFSDLEKKYYNKVIGYKKFIFLKRKNQFSSYINSLKTNFFITFTSSLGFELMARGNRVVFYFNFENRKKKI